MIRPMIALAIALTAATGCQGDPAVKSADTVTLHSTTALALVDSARGVACYRTVSKFYGGVALSCVRVAP